MKTKAIISKFKMLLLLVAASFTFSCAGLFDAFMEGRLAEDGTVVDPIDSDIEVPNFLVGGSTGLGWDSNDGNSATTLCFGAEFLYNIFEDDRNGAGYIGGFAGYHNWSADDSKENILRLGPKFVYFDPITPRGEVDLTYGIKGFYETGSREIFSSKDDITGWGVTSFVGANYNINERLSIGLELPFFGWSERTFKFDGGEVKQDNTSLAINKNNPAMAYIRFGF